jgi:hypothetical protein
LTSRRFHSNIRAIVHEIREERRAWFMFFLWILYIAIIVLEVVAFWMLFAKAGKPGWAAIIPFYNIWVAWEVAGKPGWWLVFYFIPIVNIVFWIIWCLQIAPRFGQGTGFAVGIIFLPFIFVPIMAFDKSKYIAPGASSAPAAPAAPPPPAAKPQ